VDSIGGICKQRANSDVSELCESLIPILYRDLFSSPNPSKGGGIKAHPNLPEGKEFSPLEGRLRGVFCHAKLVEASFTLKLKALVFYLLDLLL
jgi:hypothetical protein